MKAKISIRNKRELIAELKDQYSVTELCKTLGIKHDAYYYTPQPRILPNEIVKAVNASFYGSNRAYGAEKIAVELKQKGFAVATKTVSKIMKSEGLVSKYTQRRSKQAAARTNRDPINNKHDLNFGGYKTKEVLVTDLTYVRLGNIWPYICLIVELSHREILGYAAGPNKDAELVWQAIYSIKCDLSEIGMVHSDRGGEFKNEELESIFKTFGIERSLSRPGKPIDNAVAESMYDILKTEFIFDERFTDLENLRKRLADWFFLVQ